MEAYTLYIFPRPIPVYIPLSTCLHFESHLKLLPGFRAF